MRSEEIRKDELREAGDTPRDLSKNVQDCAYFLREIAAQLAEHNERERGQGEDGGAQHACVCVHCGKVSGPQEYAPFPTEVPPEDFPVPAHGRLESATIAPPKPQAGDVIAQAMDAARIMEADQEAHWRSRMTAAAQVIVRALLTKAGTIDRETGYSTPAIEIITEAARNLVLEVRG